MLNAIISYTSTIIINKCLFITTTIIKFHIYKKNVKEKKKSYYFKLSYELNELPSSNIYKTKVVWPLVELIILSHKLSIAYNFIYKYNYNKWLMLWYIISNTNTTIINKCLLIATLFIKVLI